MGTLAQRKRTMRRRQLHQRQAEQRRHDQRQVEAWLKWQAEETETLRKVLVSELPTPAVPEFVEFFCGGLHGDLADVAVGCLEEGMRAVTTDLVAGGLNPGDVWCRAGGGVPFNGCQCYLLSVEALRKTEAEEEDPTVLSHWLFEIAVETCVDHYEAEYVPNGNLRLAEWDRDDDE